MVYVAQADDRQMQLAEEFEAAWMLAVVTDCSASTVTLRLDGSEVVYGILAEGPAFGVGEVVELCPTWAMIRVGDVVFVIFSTGEELSYPEGCEPVLPVQARGWSGVACAGWLYGRQYWLDHGMWIDDEFAEIDEGEDGEEFGDWAHRGHVAMRDAANGDQRRDPESSRGGAPSTEPSREVMIARVGEGFVAVKKVVYEALHGLPAGMSLVANCRTWGEFRALDLTDLWLLTLVAEISGFEDLEEPGDADDFDVAFTDFGNLDLRRFLHLATDDLLREICEEDDGFPVELYSGDEHLRHVELANVGPLVIQLVERGWPVSIPGLERIAASESVSRPARGRRSGDVVRIRRRRKGGAAPGDKAVESP